MDAEHRDPAEEAPAEGLNQAGCCSVVRLRFADTCCAEHLDPAEGLNQSSACSVATFLRLLHGFSAA